MPLYAHALIVDGDARYQRGDEVPDDLPGIDELREAGSVSAESYDPTVDVSPPPDYVEIDGVRYVKVSDGAEEEQNARA